MLVRMAAPARRLRDDVVSNRIDHLGPRGKGLVQVAVSALRTARAGEERAPVAGRIASSNRFAGS
ncbi:hypothetical protein GCM10010383_56130 [Streptomyces lomondensis]|uniref:Uncharacterized protein n=1 Tax=Streptomyces lomondensis TaxID=68229 RepID=A0ABQ2XIS4_9ACTN|nr:hypothetical protein GCM10010383_56130 [Streptomyces lomondensis]